MHKILQQLHDDHVNYAKLLKLLKRNITDLGEGNDPDFHQLFLIMKYMVNYPDKFHHPLEEIIFEQFNATHGDEVQSIGEIGNEHTKLADLGQSLMDKLQIVISGNVVLRQEILDSANEYLQLMYSHMNIEENDAFPVLEKALTDDDWEIIEAKIEDARDPIFGEVSSKEFASLYSAITQ